MHANDTLAKGFEKGQMSEKHDEPKDSQKQKTLLVQWKVEISPIFIIQPVNWKLMKN